jgi:hypothetical protein
MSDLPTVGHNIVLSNIAERLEADFSALLAATADELNAAETLPETVENSTDMAEVAAVIIKLRDFAARAESHRQTEKQIWLRSAQAIDAFFIRRLKEPLDRMRKILSGRLNTYKQRQLAEARAQRETEATEARQRQLQAQRTREAAEDAVGRARSTESKLQREQEAASARVESDVADARVEDAMLQTKTKAASLVGERFEGLERSGLVTMRKHEVILINDIAKLDLEKLRPYLKEEHLLQALRQWARATHYKEKMPGAVVEMRDVTVVR